MGVVVVLYEIYWRLLIYIFLFLRFIYISVDIYFGRFDYFSYDVIDVILGIFIEIYIYSRSWDYFVVFFFGWVFL